ncbi:hypothetical protein SLA2020_057430 [Shorea laevis]
MFAYRFFITLFLLSLLNFTTEAQNQTYLYHFCSNSTSFTRNSTYQSNLNSLLSALSSNATATATATSTNGFDYTPLGKPQWGLRSLRLPRRRFNHYLSKLHHVCHRRCDSALPC